MDTVDRETRSRIMASVRQRDTGPETTLRSALHRAGLRYRLHDQTLPGSPDLVFRRFNAAVFVHGCYWHSHGCYKSTVPKSRREFWETKFSANRQRDQHKVALLRGAGWRVLTVWECVLVGKHALSPETVAARVRAWLTGTVKLAEIPEGPP